MKLQRKEKQGPIVEVLLGIWEDRYLIYPDVTGMVAWYDQASYKALEYEPDYLIEDEDRPQQKVTEFFKRKYDLDFHIGHLEWNETLSPLYYKHKRIKLALESIGSDHLFHATESVYSDDFYFAMLVGKFESINEIIDAQLQEQEEHSRFEWHKITSKVNPEQALSDEATEKGIIELCQFVASKIIKGKYSAYLFTDIYAIWKTFLLGGNFLTYGEIKIVDHLEPKFICTFIKGTTTYHFNYQFFVC